MNYHKLIYIIHILFVSPLLILSGYKGRQLAKNDKLSKNLFEFLIAVGLFVGLYHVYKLIT
jgi:hypothetical protein